MELNLTRSIFLIVTVVFIVCIGVLPNVPVIVISLLQQQSKARLSTDLSETCLQICGTKRYLHADPAPAPQSPLAQCLSVLRFMSINERHGNSECRYTIFATYKPLGFILCAKINYRHPWDLYKYSIKLNAGAV